MRSTYGRLMTVGVLIIAVIVLALYAMRAGRLDNIPRILIFQINPQEWADALKLGFYDGLVEEGLDIGRDVIVVQKSAASDPQAVTVLAETVAKGDYALIYTLGTQATQEVFRARSNKPILFGAVTDPVKAGFFEGTLSKPKGPISGTQDIWPYSAQFDLIRMLVPNAKRIGTLYNSNEINSQVSIDSVRRECQRRGIQLIEKTITDETQIQLALAGLLGGGIDAMFIPADNTAQGNSQVILAACERQGIPVFTGIPGIVENGALATVGTNYYELGKVNARQAAKILRGIDVSEVPVQTADQGDTYINLASAKRLNLFVPSDVIKSAFKVYE